MYLAKSLYRLHKNKYLTKVGIEYRKNWYNMANNNKYNFQKLTPVKDVDIKSASYQDALDFVFENNELRNVALSGSYGSGKSSILESYKEHRKCNEHKYEKLEFLHISLARFESVEENINAESKIPDKKPIKNSVLEGKIINQLIHQIDPKNIPQTSFGLKHNKTKKDLIIYVVLAILFGLFLPYIILANEWKKLDLSPIYVVFNKILQNLKFSPEVVFSLLLVFVCILVSYFLYKIIKSKIKKSIIKNVNHFIHKINQKNILQTSLKVISLILTMLLGYVIFTERANQEHSLIYVALDKVSQDLKSSSEITFLLFILFVCAVITSYFLYKVIKLQIDKGVFKKIGTNNIEIEMFNKESDDSVFDKYLNEVLYLFELSRADVIVFEDMDRYNVNLIFERLREVNNLINVRRQKRISHDSFQLSKQEQITPKSLRFFYLLRDDIFTSKDRMKFFDFIIPIVPVVSSSNSYYKLLELFNENMISSVKFDKNFLETILIFINDMRVLKNICNEFTIYYERLNASTVKPEEHIIKSKNVKKAEIPESTESVDSIEKAEMPESAESVDSIEKAEIPESAESVDSIEKAEIPESALDSNKMMAMIIYKNLFPHDFNNLQLGKGFVFALLDKEKRFITKIFDDKQNEAKNRLKKYKNIYDKNNTLQQELKTKIERFENVRKRIKESKSLKDFIESDNLNARENINEIFSTIENEIGIKFNFKDVGYNSNFDFLRFLILDGYLDESYADYMNYSYERSLKHTDTAFVQNIRARKKMEYNYELREPDKVIEKLTTLDFNRPWILNFNLFDYLLKTFDKKPKHKEYLNTLVKQLERDKNGDFVKKYFQKKDGIKDTSTSGISKELIAMRVSQDVSLKLSKLLNESQQQFIDHRDGKVYNIVKIGNQTWMAKNLNFIGDGTIGRYYNDDSNIGAIFGRLYSWEEAIKACPSGWHLPSDDDWTSLTNFVSTDGLGADACTKLKAASDWGNNGNGTDEFGFSALPGGRYNDNDFANVGFNGFFWSITKYDASLVWYRSMNFNLAKVYRSHSEKSRLFSVRCVQD
jgi:uncharacterized protein (TIGR02145 family)